MRSQAAGRPSVVISIAVAIAAGLPSRPAVAGGGPKNALVIIDPLVDRMVGTNLANQPTAAEIQPLLNTLIGDLTAGCDASNCDATRTRTVVKAVCAAVLSSAPILIQ